VFDAQGQRNPNYSQCLIVKRAIFTRNPNLQKMFDAQGHQFRKKPQFADSVFDVQTTSFPNCNVGQQIRALSISELEFGSVCARARARLFASRQSCQTFSHNTIWKAAFFFRHS
jgi:hypothetical protein